MKHTEKKKVNRYFNGVKKTRLIVSVEQSTVDLIDELKNHSTNGNRSEFVRMAINEKLTRERNKSTSF